MGKSKIIVCVAVVLLGGIAIVFGLAIQAASPVALFNMLVPKDGGVERFADIAYGADPRQRLDIYRPQEAGNGLPVVFFAYGGSWAEGDKDHYAFAGRAFAAQGYVTVIADYRLVPTHPYPDFVEDMQAALEWVGGEISGYGGNAGRVGLAGHSAGAYNLSMVLLADQFRLDPASGVTIRAFAGLAGPYDFYPFDVEATVNAFGRYPDPESTQPVNHLREDVPAVLLIHGDDDETVLPRNSLALAQGLSGQGASVELALYEGVDHAGVLIALARPLRWMNPVFADMTLFFRAHL